VVPASELAAARAQIAQLQRMLGKKTMEAKILKEAVDFARDKKWLARALVAEGARRDWPIADVWLSTRWCTGQPSAHGSRLGAV
jgi:hypothetical protein